ncbi:hypothetical protein MMAG44476_34194 [Mycolicibacterium mageritense DSM 44476 = CIP 104973]|uniref:Uncharacterized protein n=1 Tax=Mycolicibacterium mageritense TaxID=53462 RepID=A0ABM7HP87_MYCME|nr:hypothetical protein MMAGJ_16170 [Mycolicibacterium mageritense]CDO23123.1 hypothetical protein BN978_03602 [Mycolicibacterium mageritense DSM 44476 = CIP 104973]
MFSDTVVTPLKIDSAFAARGEKGVAMDAFLEDIHGWIDVRHRGANEHRMPSARQLVFKVDCSERPASQLVKPILNQHDPFTTSVAMKKPVVYDGVDVHHRQAMVLSECTDCGFLQQFAILPE